MSLGKLSRSQVAKNRRVVFHRDGNECVCAGMFEAVQWPCGGSLTVQHRVGRGMGGSAKWDEPKALLAMCAVHNMLQTADADFDALCKAYGWSVPRWLGDRVQLSRIPVRYADGWMLLDGVARFPIAESLARELMEEYYGE